MDENMVQQNKRRRKPSQPQPLQQGNLDGLCGIYSIINAIRLLCPEVKRLETFILFYQLMKVSKVKNGRLFETLTEGLTRKQLKRLLIKAINIVKRNYGITLKVMKYAKIVKTKSKLTLKSFWSTANQQLEQHAVILVGFSGKQDHWSIISNLTPKTLILFDSSNLKQIRKSQCSAKYAPNKYCLERKDILFLKRISQ